MPSWLPPLITLNEFKGDFGSFLEVIYQRFKRDFVRSRPNFKGLSVAIKRYPMVLGKEATFWHLVSEGKDEENRTPDLRRCERICWPRSVIEHASDHNVKCWSNTRRRGEKRWVLWLESAEYLVVLADRRDYVVLWTAYQVTEEHRKRKLNKEFEKYRAQQS